MSTVPIQSNSFAGILHRSWTYLLTRGIIAILFAILAFTVPSLSLLTIVIAFGAYCLVDGCFNIITAFKSRQTNKFWVALLLQGIIGVLIGLISLTSPGITELALVMYIAIWAMTSGILQIISAIKLRKEIDNEWLLILCGVLSIMLGIVLMIQPEVSALSILWCLAIYAFIFGIFSIILGFKVKNFQKDTIKKVNHIN